MIFNGILISMTIVLFCMSFYMMKFYKGDKIKKEHKLMITIAFVIFLIVTFFEVITRDIRISIYLIIIGILLFGLVIFIHELGHFIFAKWAGVKVHEFAIGMGPTIFYFSKGETKYALRLFPIGGFCAMEGEDKQSDDECSFGKKPVWKRICIVAAGAVMNFILGIILMLILLSQAPRFSTTVVDKFADGAVSSQVLHSNDKILSIDGYPVWTAKDIYSAMTLANATADKNAEERKVIYKWHRLLISLLSGQLNNLVKVDRLIFLIQPLDQRQRKSSNAYRYNDSSEHQACGNRIDIVCRIGYLSYQDRSQAAFNIALGCQKQINRTVHNPNADHLFDQVVLQKKVQKTDAEQNDRRCFIVIDQQVFHYNSPFVNSA